VHAIALLGGVSKQLARYYPGLFDAVLVIACVAAVMLREGRWWARLWAWVVIFILLAAIGTTDVLHATNFTLRHRPTEGIVAAAPVVAVLLAFSLLLTLLRQSRPHAPEPAGPATVEVPALPAAVAGAPIALPAAPAQAPTESWPADDVSWPAEPEPTEPAPGRGIRYAGSDVPGMAGKPQADEPDATDAAEREDYAASDEDGRYAGLIYNAPDDRRDPEDDHQGPDDDDDDSGERDDADAGEPDAGKTPPELDDDAPPFATAPFASIPRLNRVRSTPTPPEDEDE
jgi:hypothetical protein